MLAGKSNIAFASAEHDWQLSLPSGWSVLPKFPGEMKSGAPPLEVFAHPQDPALSMTWMRSMNPVGLRFWRQFEEATARPGLISPVLAHELIFQVFPLLGRTVTAFVVILPDGSRALELTEEISDTNSCSEAMRGYHLLLPVKTTEQGPPYMQQIVFCARLSKFAQEIVEIIRAARSFRYY